MPDSIEHSNEASTAEKPSFWRLLSEVKHIGWIGALLIGGLAILAVVQWIQPQSEPPDAADASAPRANSSETEMEERVQEVLSLVDGAGAVRVVISGEETASGVIVVAEGADDLAVRLELSRAVQSLLGVPNAKIEVLPMAKTTTEPAQSAPETKGE